MADKGFAERRRLELGDIAEATGIHRSTLSRVLNQPGVNLTADYMSRLCAFFGCSLGELAEYVPDDPASSPPAPSRKPAAGKPVPRKTSRRGAAQSRLF